MLYGQWWGHIKGANNAYIIMNIDKIKEDKEGSITLEPEDDHTFQNVVRVTFKNVDCNCIEGNLDRFIGFQDGKIIYPDVTDKYSQSGSGVFKGKKEQEGDRVQLVGKWSTNLGFEGDVTLTKVAPPIAEKVNEIITWEEFKEKINKYSNKYEEVFFRGQNNSICPLRTRFHKAGCWDIYRFFNEKLPELFDYLGVLNRTRYSPYNDYDFGAALLLAQHHGFPTPLLDWTLSPYIAAYFAFRFNDNKRSLAQSVRVFAFHQKRWADEQQKHTLGGFIMPNITVKPLNIPLAGNPRAVAQCARSVFSNVENIENVLKWAEFESAGDEGMPPPYLDYFDITISDRDKALNELKTMNITEIVLFPDLDTICKELGREYFQGYFDNPFEHQN